MPDKVKIGGRWIGAGEPAYVIGEIGINHNGLLQVAMKLIDAAVEAGCDAVKFQKRTPELCVPRDQQNVMRETPWGYMTYMQYRHHVEFGYREYKEIDAYCKTRNIQWFASCWDEPSVNFMEQFDPPCYKIQSAAVTDLILLQRLKDTNRPLILSTGMSTMDQISTAVRLLGTDNLILCHTTSTYPCPPEELNLNMIPALQNEFDCPIGYSGHEVGLVPSAAAVALGACLIERHITLDRAMWGSDQAASVEPGGLKKLVKYVRITEQAMGDGVKCVYDSEKGVMKKLRRAVPAGHEVREDVAEVKDEDKTPNKLSSPAQL